MGYHSLWHKLDGCIYVNQDNRMKYAIIADNGRKRVTLASDDTIDIDITEGNKRIFTLSLRNGRLYDEFDNKIAHACIFCGKGEATLGDYCRSCSDNIPI